MLCPLSNMQFPRKTKIKTKTKNILELEYFLTQFFEKVITINEGQISQSIQS